MRKFIFLGIASAFASAAFGQNLVQNGNFSAGTAGTFGDTAPPSWSLQGASAGEDCFYSTTGGANAGDGYFAFGATSLIDDVIFQTINTTAGHSYTFSMMLLGGGTPEDVNVYWNTSSFTGNGNVFHGNNLGTDGTWSTMSWTVAATGSTTVIGIGGYNSPSFSDLTEVSVTPVNAPEPASMAMLGLGAVALVARRRNRK